MDTQIASAIAFGTPPDRICVLAFAGLGRLLTPGLQPWEVTCRAMSGGFLSE
jgi:hypothetical protein